MPRVTWVCVLCALSLVASPALSLKVTDQIHHLCKEFVSYPGGFPVDLRSYQKGTLTGNGSLFRPDAKVHSSEEVQL